MRWGDERTPRRPALPVEERSDDLLQLLQPEQRSPDFVPGVMEKLGYEAVPPVVVKRRRRMRGVIRAGMTLASLAIVAAGVQVSGLLPSARTPAGPSVPSAIHEDLQQRHHRFERTIRTIRSLTPPAPIDDDIDRSTVGPFRLL